MLKNKEQPNTFLYIRPPLVSVAGEVFPTRNSGVQPWVASFSLIFFVSLFFLSKTSYAEERSSIWQNRQKPISQTFERTFDPLKIKIPEQYGIIIESHRGSNNKLIVHIQDAHANYEGQMNLANILESLIKGYNLNLILVEGGSTESDFTYLRNRASLAERKEKAQKLLKDGVISGEEYLNIASDYPMSFQGIEDRAVYDANINAMWEVDKFKVVAMGYVNSFIVSADILKSKIYNNDLLDFDKTKKDR